MDARRPRRILASLLLLLRLASTLHPPLRTTPALRPPPVRRRHSRAVSASAVVSPAVSLVSGMLGGAIGVGAAYPLDTIKVKIQAYGARDGDAATQDTLALTLRVLRDEGPAGFYAGVSSTMVGQAVIKGVVFCTYEGAKPLIAAALGSADASQITVCALAACLSGAVGSFIVTPVERVKVVMQAAGASEFASPAACVSELIRADGVGGVLFRGLDATLVREVPRDHAEMR